jgi:hypothetical protein
MDSIARFRRSAGIGSSIRRIRRISRSVEAAEAHFLMVADHVETKPFLTFIVGGCRLD